MIKWFQLAILICVAGLSGCSEPEPKSDLLSETKSGAVYYLVRHAEKTAAKDDPGLTAEGVKRAQDLAARLAEVPLTTIYSSDYIRTRDTAAPVAQAKNLEVLLYDPGQLEDFAKTLLTQSGHILVVGHSNTTPQLSEFLGGETGQPIVEATEYNRFYVVTRKENYVMSRIETFGD